MIDVPNNLKERMRVVYPPHNNLLFEEYFYDSYVKSPTESERIYIPILWTNLYVNRNYGHGDLSDIQRFLDSLDRTKKYYTIVQYDDNILNSLDGLDIKIFTMGGYGKHKDKCYPIPLNCLPPPNIVEREKNIFASFIGSIKGRHIIREKINGTLKSNGDYVISESVGYPRFREIMSSSTFSLCPRGYGQTSFRICEALQVGSIPVYVYDDPLIPFKNEFNFNDIGVLIHESEIGEIDNVLKSKSEEDVKNMQENGKKIYNEYFEYGGCYKSIVEILSIEG